MNVGLLNLFISYTYVLPKPRNDTLTGTSLNNELLDYSISGSLTITVCCLKKQFQRGTNYQNSKTIYVNHTRTRSSDFWKKKKKLTRICSREGIQGLLIPIDLSNNGRIVHLGCRGFTAPPRHIKFQRN